MVVSSCSSGPLMSSDRMLQAMSNVALALHVLFESADDTSFWKPYLGAQVYFRTVTSRVAYHVSLLINLRFSYQMFCPIRTTLLSTFHRKKLSCFKDLLLKVCKFDAQGYFSNDKLMTSLKIMSCS